MPVSFQQRPQPPCETHTDICAHTDTQTYIHAHKHTYTCTCAQRHTQTHIHHTHKHTHIHTHTYAHVHIMYTHIDTGPTGRTQGPCHAHLRSKAAKLQTLPSSRRSLSSAASSSSTPDPASSGSLGDSHMSPSLRSSERVVSTQPTSAGPCHGQY